MGNKKLKEEEDLEDLLKKKIVAILGEVTNLLIKKFGKKATINLADYSLERAAQAIALLIAADHILSDIPKELASSAREIASNMLNEVKSGINGKGHI